MNLYRLFPLPFGRGSRNAIDTHSEMVSYNLIVVKDSQALWKHRNQPDGNHIRNLFYTFIWNFCPELITQGYVYSLVAPLYKITVGKDTYIYIKDDAALEAWKAANPSKKYSLARFKGLGEMSAEETEVLVDESLRTLCQVTVEDVFATDKLFEDLMGQAVTPRKKFIQEHSTEAMIYE